MAKVFVPEHKLLDDAQASKWGSIVPLLPQDLKLGLEPERIKVLTARGVGAFNENEDYLLLDGSPVACAVIMSLLLIERSTLNLLLWDPRSRRYFNRTVSFERVSESNFTSPEKRIFASNDIHDMSGLNFPIISLTSGQDPNILEPDRILDEMIKILVTSQPHDMLLISGSKIHNCIAGGIISKMHSKVNYLLFNAQESRYVLRTCIYDLETLVRICIGL